MIEVALVDVGENLPVRLNSLADSLNQMQSAYFFTVITPIPCDVLGQPNLHFQWYFIEKLVPVLANHHKRSDFDIMVGVTHVRITREVQDDGDIYNKDYFSDSDISEKISLVSVNRNVLAFNSETKDTHQYLAFCMLSEILIQRTGNKELYHSVSKLCLFDECADRSAFASSIERSHLCAGCLANLKQGGISDTEINDIGKILTWCRKITGSHSAIAKTFKNPITSLVIGALVGWLSKNFIPPSSIIQVTIASTAIICLIYAKNLIFNSLK